MSGQKRIRYRGIALAVVLLTATAVMLLVYTYLGMVVGQNQMASLYGRNRTINNFANKGLQFTLNYMGRPDNWDSTAIIAPSDYNFVPYELLKNYDVSDQKDWMSVFITVQRQPVSDTGLFASRLETIIPIPVMENSATHFTGKWKITVRPVIRSGSLDTRAPTYIIEVDALLLDSDGSIITGRKVKAEVRERNPMDYAVFVQNMRAWDMPESRPPNSRDGTDNAAGILNGYRSYGDIRVDGMSGTSSAVPTSGNLNIWGTDIRFHGIVSTLKKNETLHKIDPDEVFAGGTEIRPGSMGLPDTRDYLSDTPNRTRDPEKMGTAEKLAYDSSGGVARVDVSDKYIERDTTRKRYYDRRLRRWVYKRSSLPGIPNVRITFTGDKNSTGKVDIKVIGKYTNKVLNRRAFYLEDIPNGVIYVKGGNVQISGEVKGQVTVVADENSDRNIYRSNIGGPYYDRRKRKWFYPPPGPFSEREGNLSLIGDLTYAGGNNNVIGVVARNYIFLNDFSGKSRLTAYGIFMSIDHSLQFDWDNMNQNPNWEKLRGGTFEFHGSLQGQYADVECDLFKKGYPIQLFYSDPRLKEVRPPGFPAWKKSLSSTIIDFFILSYSENERIKVN